MKTSAKAGVRFLAACCSWLVVLPSAWGQEDVDPLPRRGYFGVALGNGDAGEVVVTAVLEGSAAEEAGIAAGDVVKAVDGVATSSPAEVMAAIGAYRSAERVRIDIVRGGTPQNRTAVLASYPEERIDGADVTYGSVALEDGTRLRTIVSVPAGTGGPFPAVFVIQGGGCGTVDLPWPVPLGIYPLTHLIGSQGFVTMRVEKSGVGDSEGPPCAEIGYHEELAGYRAALDALRTHPAVDAKRIFLVGISLGGVFAPILANETSVAGISVYGTIDRAPSPYPGRSPRFFAELASVDVLDEWSRIDVPVQVLSGEYDEALARESRESIAETVEQAHPGRAEQRELARLDHCTTRHATREESVGRCGAGEPVTDVDETILAFLVTHAFR